MWGTLFDDIWYSKSYADTIYNSSYVDDVLLVGTDLLYMGVRLRNLKLKRARYNQK